MRQAMHGERDVNLLEIARLDAGAANEARWFRRNGSRPGETRESAFHFHYHGSMLNGACRYDDHVGTAIVTSQIGAKTRAIERPHGGRRAEDGAANRLTWEGGLLQPVPDEVVRRVLRRPDLLHDDVLLAP